MTLDESVVAIGTYLAEITGREVIQAGDNGPQPGSPYYTVDIGTVRALKYDIETEVERLGVCYGVMRGLCHVEYNLEGWDGVPVAGLLRYQSSLNSAYFCDKMPNFGVSEQSSVLEFMDPFIGSRIQTRSKTASWFYISLEQEFAIDMWESNQIVVNNDQTTYSITIDSPPN